MRFLILSNNKMSNIIVLITADTNDADYVTTFCYPDIEELEFIKKIADMVRNFEPYQVVLDSGRTWTHRHNFPLGHGDFVPRKDLGEKDVAELYNLNEDEIEMLYNIFTFSHEVHTLENIKVIEVSKIEDLV